MDSASCSDAPLGGDDGDDDEDDVPEDRDQDFHSLPPDWAQYSPPDSLSPEDFFDDPEPDPLTISRHRADHPKVSINVGGLKHEVMWRLLEKRPLTRLGMLAKAKTHEDILNLVNMSEKIFNDRQFQGRSFQQLFTNILLHIFVKFVIVPINISFTQVDAYSLSKNEIYFDRDPTTFNCVLNFYRTDRLHVLDEICILDFADDLEFWKIKELNLEVCCIDKFNARREHIIAEVEKDRHMQQVVEEVEEDFGMHKFVIGTKSISFFR